MTFHFVKLVVWTVSVFKRVDYWIHTVHKRLLRESSSLKSIKLRLETSELQVAGPAVDDGPSTVICEQQTSPKTDRSPGVAEFATKGLKDRRLPMPPTKGLNPRELPKLRPLVASTGTCRRGHCHCPRLKIKKFLLLFPHSLYLLQCG